MDGRCIDLLHWSNNGEGYHFDVMESKQQTKNADLETGIQIKPNNKNAQMKEEKNGKQSETKIGAQSGNSDGKRGTV